MLELTINGQTTSLPPQTIHSLIVSICGVNPPPQGIAVAIDGMVIRRSEWSTTQLCNGNDIEVLWASSGG